MSRVSRAVEAARSDLSELDVQQIDDFMTALSAADAETQALVVSLFEQDRDDEAVAALGFELVPADGRVGHA